jgi:hypothetical protein
MPNYGRVVNYLRFLFYFYYFPELYSGQCNKQWLTTWDSQSDMIDANTFPRGANFLPMPYFARGGRDSIIRISREFLLTLLIHLQCYNSVVLYDYAFEDMLGGLCELQKENLYF